MTPIIVLLKNVKFKPRFNIITLYLVLYNRTQLRLNKITWFNPSPMFFYPVHNNFQIFSLICTLNINYLITVVINTQQNNIFFHTLEQMDSEANILIL